MLEKHNDYYLKLRDRVNRWGHEEGASRPWLEYILLAPDLFHLLIKLSMDSQVPAMDKAKLAIAIGYFVLPLDLVPEILLGPAGYVDDVALSAYVLHSLLNTVPQEIVSKHWAGKEDVLQVIQKILKFSNEMLGSGVWGSLKRISSKSSDKL